MKPTCNDFKIKAVDALQNANLQISLAKLGDGFQARRSDAIKQLPEFEQLRDEGRAIKQYALANLDTLLNQFESNVLKQGGQVHWAHTIEDAQQAVLKICRAHGAKTVTKGKSMVTEEIGLNAFLKANNITPIETDLGEYILQIRQEAPSHVVVPAVHLLQSDIESSFRKEHTALNINRDLTAPESLVNEARELLREKFLAADIGITGANYLIAETGSSVIVTNEGNGDLTQNLPKVHVVVTTIERVIPTLNDLSTFLRLLPRSATGQEATSYVTLSTGTRRDEDVHGPEAFHVVILDNGRSNLLGTENQEVLNCIRCGACMNHCPVYGAVGGHSYGWVYPGPIGAALTPALLSVKETTALPNASTFCGKCNDVCPVKIPLTDIMRRWREQEHSRKFSPVIARWALGAWAWLACRPAFYQVAVQPAIRAMYFFAGKKNRLKTLLFAKGWTKYRDLPAPEGSTFHSQLKQQAKNNKLNGVRYE